MASTASDYRGTTPPSSEDPNSVDMQTISTKPSTAKSYVNITKSTPPTKFPKKDQAIILNPIESAKLSDYVQALGKIVGPKNILFASRITNNRICVYLSDLHQVDNLIASHKYITINDQDVGISRLITPAKRLILSNVCSSIPHDIIEESLKHLNLKLVSPITFLKAGIPGEEYNQVLSFRRQVSVSPPEDNHEEPPSSILITYEETLYRIFISTDEMTCFLWKQKGHIANACPNIHQPQAANPDLTDIIQNSSKRLALTSSNSSTSNIQSTAEESCTTSPFLSPSPPPTTESSSFPTSPSNVAKKQRLPTTQAKTKKIKRSTSVESLPNLEASFSHIKTLFENNPSQCPISFDNLKSFLENTFGNPDPLTEALRFTKDVNDIITTMQYICPHVPERALKSRLTRIVSKLKRQLEFATQQGDQSSSQYDSDLSQDSY